MDLQSLVTYGPRVGVAALAGMAIGLNRELHGKPAGLRTHGLIAMGAALVTAIAASLSPADPAAVSRVMQGVVAGLGFVGAGVVMHHDVEHRVEGLTTAATIWMVAVLGVACGIGLYALAVAGVLLALVILVLGARVEEAFLRRQRRPPREP
ncbi:MAG: MgtC/SapB family protein [Acidobacteriota bacterium]